ncbi:terpenoid synthase [Suillus bovinus]|uniref:terpenoid synthase n=1 Tax=Suillus bovinus TaxID=48563 RepID=UPI001B85DFFE|nr:terpenoid synthase [Suillus bovinus]KAG2151606.1 terpenoid synthase [Suillus bovinus]
MDQRNMVAIDANDGCDKPQKKIFIPDILARWPFPRQLNQHYFKVRVESSAWLAGFKAFSPKAQQAFDRGNFCLAACLCFPNTCEEHARSACDFMNLVFVIDEYTDVLEEDEVRQRKDVIMDALRHPHKPRPKGECVVGEVTRHTIRNASGQAQKLGVVQQAIDRKGHHIRDIQSYIDVRCRTIGARPSFALLELGLDIPDEVISHPTIKDMMAASTEMIALANDIISYNVEQVRGDDSHMTIKDTDIGESDHFSGCRHHILDCWGERRKFFEAAAAIPKWGEPIDSQVREYCDGLGNWVRANHDWSFETERYLGTNGLEIQRERWILLMPKNHRSKS